MAPEDWTTEAIWFCAYHCRSASMVSVTFCPGTAGVSTSCVHGIGSPDAPRW